LALEAGSLDAANRGSELRHQGLRNYGVAGGGTDLANVRAGAAGRYVRTKVELRPEKSQSEEQSY